MLFITHQLPKGLQVDEVFRFGQQNQAQIMGLVEEVRRDEQSRARKECDMRNIFKQFSILPRLFISIAGLAMLTCCLGCKPAKTSPKPLSLGQFSNILTISISPDGNQILFDGCGHKEYPACTLYRFDQDNNRLYRYLPRNPQESLYGGRYSPLSNRIAFSLMRVDAAGNDIFEDTQIALMQQDGSGLQIVTSGKGLKTASVLSYDEKQLAYFKSEMSSVGSPLRKQRTRAIRYDLYTLNLLTNKETCLTKYEFYNAGSAYFSSDNKKVLFEGDSPMRTPDLDQGGAYREKFKSNYQENIIFAASTDGSDVNNELIPYFTYSYGSRMPVLFKDGSLVFKGREGIQGFIHYYKRSPDGGLHKIAYEELGEGKGEDGKSLIVVREMTGTPDGRLLAILNHNQGTNQRYIRLLYLGTRQLVDLELPTTVENITLR